MLQICKADRVPSAVGLAACPECGHGEFWLQGQEPAVEPTPDTAETPVPEPAQDLTVTEKEADEQAAQARVVKPKER